MKQKLLTSLFFVAACLHSCKDDDSNTPSLTGRWNMQSHEFFGCTDASQNRTVTCPGTSSFCRDIEFKSDNTFSIYFTGATHKGTYTIAQNQIMLQETTYGYVLKYYFALSGNTITLTEVEAASSGCTEREVYLKI